MKTPLKIALSLLVLGMLGSIGIGINKLIDGSYFINASFITSFLTFFFLLLLIAGAVYAIRKIWIAVVLILMIPVLQSCSYSKANQQVVISTDCGMTWSRVNAGDAVPTGMGNRCFMKVVMPNFPMQGQAIFVSNLANKVRVKIHIDYDYSVVDPLMFIKEAKYLGRANRDADDDDALSPSAFEGAENSVIDVRVRDVSKGYLEDKDIVDADISELEDAIYKKANEILTAKGIHLNFITLTFDLDEQTRQAIDVATAMRIYEANGLTEMGKSVMTARAGATKIVIEQKEIREQASE